jgi:hypothetical protein
MAGRLQKLIMENPRITYGEIMETLHIGSAAITNLLKNSLHMKTVMCRFVPHFLTDAKITQEFLANNKIETKPHPPYSPDLAPCDFWLFPGLKRQLRGQSFRSIEELDSVVMGYFDSIPKEKWLKCFRMWKEMLNKCIELGGEYIE